jgi:hypothetical protein
MSLGALAMPTHVYAKPGISIQYWDKKLPAVEMKPIDKNVQLEDL